MTLVRIVIVSISGVANFRMDDRRGDCVIDLHGRDIFSPVGRIWQGEDGPRSAARLTWGAWCD